MSAESWNIHEHVIPASHIRGFRRGIREEKAGRLRLAIKQYVPKEISGCIARHVSIITAHGVGSSKESYEPFYDELLNRGLPIRAVWAMDVAHHGASYLLNENIIGDEPNWFDSSRDLMQMVNHFQELMPPPLVAIGQSWGSVTIAGLSIMHPRLFAGMVFLEPTFAAHYAIRAKDLTDRGTDRSHRAVAMAKRRDLWESRAGARERLSANPYYAAFDPRVFERVMKYDLRPASADQCNKAGSPNAVTLTTPKSMEVATMMRPDPPLQGYPEEPDLLNRPDDIDTTIIRGFYRGEVLKMWWNLPYILPSTLVIWAGKSLAGTNYAKEIDKRIGTGYGGNGGIAVGRVKSVDINDVGHPLPLEKPGAVAEAVSDWLHHEVVRWSTEYERPQPPFDTAVHPEVIERIAKL
ncbi:hypothetical protein G7Y79_00030g065050 [Physcia stellaris]|nr:hypothetical protein G7Y79_00030g065050 [Physcia stellaris]